MAHCNPCKSKLGTGGRINAPLRASGGGWVQPSTGQRDIDVDSLDYGPNQMMLAWPNVRNFRTGLRRRYMTLARVQRVSPSQWIPSVSSLGTTPPFYPYALYTGGKYAMLFADKTSSKRRVLEFRNGGPTNLEVRLGAIVALEAGFGTGCNTCEALLGTGGHVEEIAASRGLRPSECQVIFYDGQGYMCCGSDCVPLPITSDERSLVLPANYTSAARPRYRRHW